MPLDLDPNGVIISCPNCGRKNRLAFARLGETMRCGQCKQELRAPADPIEIPSAADFDRIVAQSSLPIVVDYWAPWCGPCRMVAPEIKKVAERQAGRFLVVKVNTEALPDLGARFGIRSIPTLAVFMNGKEVGRSAGARPAPEIEAFVEQAVHAHS
jgi:thioredoxin 2